MFQALSLSQSLSLPKRSPCPQLKTSPWPPVYSQSLQTNLLQFPWLPGGSWGLSICLYPLPGHGAVLSRTHSCTFPGRGADTVVRIALYSDSLNRHKLLKSTSHQLRILLHMLKFPSKPLLLPGLWRHSLPTE